MPDTDAEATARAEADPMGLDVLEAVDVGGTWTVAGDADTEPPPPPKPAEPPPTSTSTSKLAERPPAPVPAPPPPPDPVAPPDPVKATLPPPRGDRRRIGRWLVAAAFVAGAAVAVPLAVAATNFAHRVTNAPVPSVGSVPARYLAGTSSARVEAAAVSRGLRCTTPQSVAASATTSVRVCQRVSGGWVASVVIAGKDPGHLIAVSAGVSRGPADEATDLALLKAIVDAAVARRSAAADDAWLNAHFDQAGDNQTVANGVLLRLMVQDTIRSLVVIPAP